MASVKSTKKREEKKRQIKLAGQEAARRETQAKRPSNPEEILSGFSTDLLSLMQHFTAARMHVKQRIRQAEKLKEQDAERFNVLRVDAFRGLETTFESLNPKITLLAGMVGTLADLQTMHDKMTFFAENYSTLVDVEAEFQELGQNLQNIDMTFNQSLVKAMTPDNLDNPEAAMQFLKDTVDGADVTVTVNLFGLRRPDSDTETSIAFAVESIEASAIADEFKIADGVVLIDKNKVLDEGQDSRFPDNADKRYVNMLLSDAIADGIIHRVVEIEVEVDRSSEVDMPLTQEEAQAAIADQTVSNADTDDQSAGDTYTGPSLVNAGV